MTFNPKFPSYRMRIATLGFLFAFAGVAMLLAGHDQCHRGRDHLAIAGILLLGAAIPESPAGKKVTPEKYDLM